MKTFKLDLFHSSVISFLSCITAVKRGQKGILTVAKNLQFQSAKGKTSIYFGILNSVWM